jgi:hypothetical protein
MSVTGSVAEAQEISEFKELIEKMKAENALLREMISQSSEEDVTKYLSDKEKETLKTMNTLSNKLTEQSVFVKDILNQPVMEVIHNWSAIHQDILRDTTDLLNNSNIMDDIQTSEHWWTPIFNFLKEFVNIVTEEERMFYVGLTIVFIGLIFVFINITN